MVDAKSPYTARHSAGVAEISVCLAARWASLHARATLRRAALLHDVGKLGVSSRILDKPGPLTDAEWEVLRRHPRWSMEILTRVPAFEELARIAGHTTSGWTAAGTSPASPRASWTCPRGSWPSPMSPRRSAPSAPTAAPWPRRGDPHHSRRSRAHPARERVRGARGSAARAARARRLSQPASCALSCGSRARVCVRARASGTSRPARTQTTRNAVAIT